MGELPQDALLPVIREEFRKHTQFDLDDYALAQFASYIRLLNRYNRVLSLTSERGIERQVFKHFIESTMLLEMLPDRQGITLLDLGSGAGFPSLPMKILKPSLFITICEAGKNRAIFLSEVVNELSLGGVTIENVRADDLLPLHRREYELVTSKAFVPLPEYLVLASKFVAEDGLIGGYLGAKLRDVLHEQVVWLGLTLVAERRFENPHTRSDNLIYLLGRKGSIAGENSSDA